MKGGNEKERGDGERERRDPGEAYFTSQTDDCNYMYHVCKKVEKNKQIFNEKKKKKG